MNESMNLKIKREAVGHSIDILLYAVRATSPFKISELRKDVVESTKTKTYSIILILISFGYIEKVSCCTYQATDFAKEMFGVGVTKNDGE
ncbi:MULTISPECIES: hypothetical protein [unclassified Acinetobacter]|uniref:hypothetical protein n=1 Tax=unclassified Acinetobacter TaxID=196816 RepID=UPI0024481BA8|nr:MULTISPECIES: hypothetical protein [unclassified Acinetobacter]MDH0032034.1 hypothetical protein [Acinetobacter sp. GD04021]MDH0887690.1 hypothetical protein [Acinetobacter sp. GD03873]MDH1084038.1 hypothetical protein [Acinetobacter sp. GD03983]MDH2191035.1 hypothetical protein [Acinetobacter sp. GD03645]MDH2204550.1 hypothetical protein [Acinetobacter sp. GD03647]